MRPTSQPVAPVRTASPSRRHVPRGRLALLLLGGASLLIGLDAALLLLGLPAPLTTERLPEVHGQVMLLGFLGTLIALERAIAIRRPWAYLAPIGTGVGALLLVSPFSVQIGESLQALGLGALAFVYAVAWNRVGSSALAIQWLGGFMALGGSLLLLVGVSLPSAFPWLAAFLILTIAGERLELAHIAAPPPSAERALLVISFAIATCAMASLLWPSPGSELFGAALLALVVWLARYDIATRTVRGRGLPRYTAVNLLFGIAWLGIAGVSWLVLGPLVDGPRYDLVVHAVGLGFAMSMVLAHAPIIVPAIVLRPLPYRPLLYVATAALQLSLLLRVFGDVRSIDWAWQSGGVGNILALVLFVGTTLALVVRR